MNMSSKRLLDNSEEEEKDLSKKKTKKKLEYKLIWVIISNKHRQIDINDH